MESQQFISDSAIQAGNHPAKRLDSLRRIVHSRNDRCANNERSSRCGQTMKILDNAFVSESRPTTVFRRIGNLQVTHPKPDQRQKAFDGRPRLRQIRFDSRVNTLGQTSAKHLLGKIRLQQRFTARQRHTSARLLEKGSVKQQFTDSLLSLYLPTDPRHSPRNADFDTSPALRAMAAIDHHLLCKPEGPGLANCDTTPAPDTFTGDILQLRPSTPGFGIMAPCTPKIAPFQKKGRTDSRTVVNRHALNRGDCTFHLSDCFFYCKITG